MSENSHTFRIFTEIVVEFQAAILEHADQARPLAREIVHRLAGQRLRRRRGQVRVEPFSLFVPDRPGFCIAQLLALYARQVRVARRFLDRVDLADQRQSVRCKALRRVSADGVLRLNRELMMVLVLRRLDGTGIFDEYPNLASYVRRGEARPACKLAFADQSAVFTATSRLPAG